MAELRDLLEAQSGSVGIDWSRVEEVLEFPVHDDLKAFYSRLACGRVSGTVHFTESSMLERTGDRRNDTWFSFNECEGDAAYELYLLSSPRDAVRRVKSAFTSWTGGYDFGRRARIGAMFFNIGQVEILFNNDSGRVEWMDAGYGNFENYEENPNGVLAKSVDRFLEKLREGEA